MVFSSAETPSYALSDTSFPSSHLSRGKIEKHTATQEIPSHPEIVIISSLLCIPWFLMRSDKNKFMVIPLSHIHWFCQIHMRAAKHAFLCHLYSWVWKHNSIVLCNNYFKHPTFIHIFLHSYLDLGFPYHCGDIEVRIIQNSQDLKPIFLIVQDEHMLICSDVRRMHVCINHTLDYGFSHSQKLPDWEISISEEGCVLLMERGCCWLGRLWLQAQCVPHRQPNACLCVWLCQSSCNKCHECDDYSFKTVCNDWRYMIKCMCIITVHVCVVHLHACGYTEVWFYTTQYKSVSLQKLKECGDWYFSVCVLMCEYNLHACKSPQIQ